MSTIERWRKLGRVFCADGQFQWMRTHASHPIAEHLENDIFRVYFSCRDLENRSHTAYVDIDILQPQRILNLSQTPVLTPGAIGGFDDSGAMGSWIVLDGDQRFLFYQGWNLGVTVPFRNSIGLAVSKGRSEFKRYCIGPIVDRTMFEPYFTGTPCVVKDGETWRMWYLSCTEWQLRGSVPRHRYHIKYAESRDGIEWCREGRVAIDYLDQDEYAISRPAVVHDTDCWRMWYSYRGDAYRIGYAESADGRSWQRLDGRAGIDRSASGWDSEMIEYPFVFDHRGQRFMLYNGDAFGRTGFGIAVLSEV